MRGWAYINRMKTCSLGFNGLVLLINLFFLSACLEKDVPPPQPLDVVPTAAQLRWHRMEMNAFVHFSINTFTDKEWGYGDESPTLFNPDSLDTDQWVSVFREVGFRTVILTCKHHDGFCLWPSRHTSHSVASSPVKTDVVGALVNSSRKQGLDFGIYLSPWDRNHAQYGKPEYVEYYRNQLRELFAAYGPVVEMWFDGANGGDGFYGGAREQRRIDGASYYDWPGTLDLVRSLSPEVIFFSDAGPGVRWVGNERGVSGETNWNTITADTLFAGKPGLESLLATGHPDGRKWIPAEVDVSIRPGWFYHAREDSLVKSPEKLFDIYLTSVGRGSTLLLNVPPDRHGRLHRKDVAALRGFRRLLDSAFRNDLAAQAEFSTSSVRGGSEAQFGAGLLRDGSDTTYWATDDNVRSAELRLDWNAPQSIRYLMIQEPVFMGQRVSRFRIETETEDGVRVLASGTTIGYKRIVQLSGNEAVRLDNIKLVIEDSKGCVALAEVRAY